MSFMKRMLSSVGIGNAKVDTVLDRDRYAPGDTVEAVVNITGGKVEQKIEEIYFSLHCNYEVERDDRIFTNVAVLDKFRLGEELFVGPGEKLEFPLSFELPVETPITIGKTKVWIQTGMDIKMAVDPGDRDYIQVTPDYLTGALFDAIHELGFELREAECEAISHNPYSQMPFVQEFEFQAYSGPFRGRLDELEMVCFPKHDRVEVVLEIDRKARGFSGFISDMLDTDETRVRFTLLEQDVPNLTSHLHDLIEKWT